MWHQKKWVPFRQIQVRSIITTFLCDLTETQLEQGFGTVLPANEHVSDCRSLLAQLRVRYDQAKTAALADRVLFYDSILPEETQKLRELLKESNFARLYQVIGQNLRLSGGPSSDVLVENKFLTLAKRLNEVIVVMRDGSSRINKLPGASTHPPPRRWRLPGACRNDVLGRNKLPGACTDGCHRINKLPGASRNDVAGRGRECQSRQQLRR